MTTEARKHGSTSALALMICAVYMISYMTRVNLAAIVTEIEAVSGISRSSLSFALTGSFIAYGTGQVLSGFLGDRISPKLEVCVGLSLTSLMNILMAFCTNAVGMTVLWCINGFAQSLMWPPIVKIMADSMSDDDFKRTTTGVSLAGTAGQVCVYLTAPLIISLWGYRWVFILSGACAILMLCAWCIFGKNTERRRAEEKTEERLEDRNGKKYNIFTPIAILLLVATALQGALRDGVTTWTPTYISDTFSLGSEISILTGVVLPLFAMVSVYLTSMIYRRYKGNPITMSGIIFAAAAVFALLIFVVGDGAVVFSVLFTALLTASMHAINFLLIGMVPGFLAKYSNISFLSGVINSATYVGSALSTYGIAALSEEYGWSFTISLWIAVAAVGAILCFATARPFVRSAEPTEDK